MSPSWNSRSMNRLSSSRIGSEGGRGGHRPPAALGELTAFAGSLARVGAMQAAIGSRHSAPASPAEKPETLKPFTGGTARISASAADRAGKHRPEASGGSATP
jgi:hypothetical protein